MGGGVEGGIVPKVLINDAKLKYVIMRTLLI